MSKIKAGDFVRIKPEWRENPGDPKYNFVYVVKEWNGDRGYIVALNTGLDFPPEELVRENMIEMEEEC